MKYTLKEISATEFDQFFDTFTGDKTFLQTSKFGEFREKLEEKNFRYGIFENENLIGIAQFQKICARRGTFLHISHGPLILPSFVKGGAGGGFPALLFFLEEIEKIGHHEGCDFIRVSPLLPQETESLFQKAGFRPAPLHINPNRTWILDLTPPLEEILTQMRKSTRYEIRRIQKCGIEVSKGNSEKDLDIFWNLHQKTIARQGFQPFPRESTKIELEVFGSDCQIFSAKIGNDFLSSSIILFDAHAAYYHQGASVYSKAPVAHATIWAAIQEAKDRGCKFFNFWGVSPEDNPKHPWTGLSRFKRGFGGVEQVFLPAQDFPLTRKYWLNWLVEKGRVGNRLFERVIQFLVGAVGRLE